MSTASYSGFLASCLDVHTFWRSDFLLNLNFLVIQSFMLQRFCLGVIRYSQPLQRVAELGCFRVLLVPVINEKGTSNRISKLIRGKKLRGMNLNSLRELSHKVDEGSGIETFPRSIKAATSPFYHRSCCVTGVSLCTPSPCQNTSRRPKAARDRHCN